MLALLGGPAKYVLVALLALAALVASHEIGFRRAQVAGAQRLAAYQAQAQAESEKLKAKAAEVREKVVIQYRDRIREIRVVEPEVIREIEVIRNSGCSLPAAWVRLYNSSAKGWIDPAPGVDDPGAEITCADAIEILREGSKRFAENAEQLTALQAWAAGVSQP